MKAKHGSVRKTFALAALGCLLAGCAGQVATHDEAVESLKNNEVVQETPDTFAGKAESGEVDDGWLKAFNDPKLDELVQEALARNPGLEISEAQVDQAMAMISQAEAKLKPMVGLGGSYADSEYLGTREKSLAGIGVSWEADVWGRLRTGVAEEKEAAQATLADYQFARQSLAAAVARGWFVAITAKLQLKLAKEIVEVQTRNLEMSKASQKIGQGSMRDVHLAKAALASAKEAAQAAQSSYEDALRSLEILVGRYPSAEFQTEDMLVAVPPPIPAGIPSQILERRPDLKAAEYKVAQAFYREKEANLLHLPRFTFSVGLGVNSINDAIAGLAAGIFAPLYTGGAIKAEVEKATAEQKAAIAAYAQKALAAFKEVESALAAEDYLAKREEDLRQVVEENKTAYEQTLEQYKIGEINYLDVITVQERWINARVAYLDMKSRRLINRINLHLALGGSFDEQPATAAPVPASATAESQQ
jgi:NodT family efflux transporter outer membrane factor (OMF) lipoprotein